MEGDLAAVEAYKSSGGDIARQLTADEVRLLNRPSAFDAGFTLVHLAIRFQRQDMLAVLLTEVRGQPQGQMGNVVQMSVQCGVQGIGFFHTFRCMNHKHKTQGLSHFQFTDKEAELGCLSDICS